MNNRDFSRVEIQEIGTRARAAARLLHCPAGYGITAIAWRYYWDLAQAADELDENKAWEEWGRKQDESK